MTIQLAPSHINASKSKAKLQAALNDTPSLVNFYDPSIFPGSRGHFSARSVQVGESFVVVMDPQTRRRFALVELTAKGWKVK